MNPLFALSKVAVYKAVSLMSSAMSATIGVAAALDLPEHTSLLVVGLAMLVAAHQVRRQSTSRTHPPVQV